MPAALSRCLWGQSPVIAALCHFLAGQHRAPGADKVTTGSIDAHIEAGQQRRDDDDGMAAALVPAG